MFLVRETSLISEDNMSEQFSKLKEFED